jgi:AraC family transcriptional regulator
MRWSGSRDTASVKSLPNLPSSFHYETLAAGRWAVAVHQGSYNTLSNTYLRLVGGWIPQHHHGLDDRPCLEFYLNSPATAAESDLRTEVWAPLASY